MVDLCPVNASTVPNKCCLVCSPWRNSWTRFRQGIGSPERCWLSFESWKESLLHGAVVPLHHCISVCGPRLLLSLLFTFPALCERLWRTVLRQEGFGSGAAISCYPRLSLSPGSLLSAQKRPVVLRYRPVSCCAVAVMFTCCIAVKVRG